MVVLPPLALRLSLNFYLKQTETYLQYYSAQHNVTQDIMAPAKTEDVAPTPVSQETKLPERPKEDISVLNEAERAELAFTDKYSAPDVFINGKKDTLWFPWIGPIELKPLRMENRTGTFVVALRSAVAAGLGKHRHRGSVTAITISGAWGYKEYVNSIPVNSTNKLFANLSQV